MPFYTLTVGEGWEIFERRKSGVSFRKLRFGKKCEAERTEVERQDELFCKTAYFIERKKELVALKER
jgi:hypothetical protein